MLRRCLLLLTLSFTLSTAALFGRDLQTVSADTIILTVLLSPGEPPLQVTLRQMMDIYKDPGFSAAIIEHSRVVWAKGLGVTAPGGNTRVTPGTLFQAASISKPITAAGGLWLVQHGKVSLDEDVNLKLKSWKVPENDFTATQKVTLRRLMSHNAGVNVHGFAGYAQGSPLPTAEQTLDGLPPANNPERSRSGVRLRRGRSTAPPLTTLAMAIARPDERRRHLVADSATITPTGERKPHGREESHRLRRHPKR